MPNRRRKGVRSFCQRLVADPEYRAAFEQRWRSGTLPAAMEALIWAYAIGKPGQSVEVTSRGLSLAELIVGGVPNDEDLERGEPSGQPPINDSW